MKKRMMKWGGFCFFTSRLLGYFINAVLPYKQWRNSFERANFCPLSSKIGLFSGSEVATHTARIPLTVFPFKS
jgi:hypothetical protein